MKINLLKVPKFERHDTNVQVTNEELLSILYWSNDLVDNFVANENACNVRHARMVHVFAAGRNPICINSTKRFVDYSEFCFMRRFNKSVYVE